MSRTTRKVPEWVDAKSNDHLNGSPNGLYANPHGFTTRRDLFRFEFAHGLTKPFNLIGGDGVVVGRRCAKAQKKRFSKLARAESKRIVMDEVTRYYAGTDIPDPTEPEEIVDNFLFDDEDEFMLVRHGAVWEVVTRYPNDYGHEDDFDALGYYGYGDDSDYALCAHPMDDINHDDLAEEVLTLADILEAALKKHAA